MNDALLQRVAMVAGEASGDLLGAGLIDSLNSGVPNPVLYYGIGGPQMRERGCECWFDSSELAVMGLFEVIAHLPRLLRLRAGLVQRLLVDRPDVFVGIDAPDFNIGVERKLRAAGITTVHYVSPSVWAWRPQRARKMAQASDLVLCLLPFEPAFYQQYDVQACFVGHPLADQIAMRTPQEPARDALQLEQGIKTVAVLPGSREGEVRKLGAVFAETMQLLTKRHGQIQFVAPMANRTLRPVFAQFVKQHAPDARLKMTDGQARQAIAAADAVLVASGTATLEALLVKRPMVVAYRLAETTRILLEKLKLLQIDQFALPNLLAQETLVPEVLQGDLSADRLANELERQLERGHDEPQWLAQCDEIHRQLRCNASSTAADAIITMIGAKG